MTPDPSCPSERPDRRTFGPAHIGACALALVLIVLGLLHARSAGRASGGLGRAGGRAIRVDAEPRMMLGSFVHMSAVSAVKSREEIKGAIADAFARIADVDRLMSLYKQDSEVSRLNRDGKIVASPDTLAVVKKALEVSDWSGGAFDITVPPILRLWKDAAKRGQPPTDAELREACSLVGYRSVAVEAKTGEIALLKKGVTLDLGGLAPGYAVDTAAEAFRRKGIADFMIEAGGEVYCGGQRDDKTPWRIGVQDPRSERDAPKLLDIILGLSDIAVATSGNYEQFVVIGEKRFSHIVDPRTGRTAEGVPGATIIAPDCMTADALATAVSVLGVEKGMAVIESLPGVEALLVTVNEGRLAFHKSKGFDKFILEGRP